MTTEERAEQLQLAYDMAWFIHRNKQVAYLIAMEVVYRWEALPPQGQRLLSKAQKFQRLVFEVSAYFEMAIEAISAGVEAKIEEQVRRLIMNMRHLESTEQPGTTAVRKYLSILTPIATKLEDHTMMTHYLKHLAMIALRHSLVKTTVSYLQLLYRFATSETRCIYEHLETSLERIGEAKDLQFFARARRELLDDLRNRFRDLLRIELCQAPNGATTLQLAAFPATQDQAEFAKECLREFSPSDVRRSSCTPSKFRNKGEFVYQLLYPEQFQIVLAETGLSATPQPLFWPVFTNTEKPASPSSPRRSPPPRPSPPLHGREVRVAVSRLSLAAKRRRRWGGRVLQIVVNGREHTQFNLDEVLQTTLQLSADAGTIEVVAQTEGGNILLAQYLVSEEEFDPKHPRSKQTVALGGGRKIRFTITPDANGIGAEVTIRYQESVVARIVLQTKLFLSWLLARIVLQTKLFLSWLQSLVDHPWFPSSVDPQRALLFKVLKGTMVLAPMCLTILLGVRVSQSLIVPQFVTRKDLPAQALVPPKPPGGGQAKAPILGDPGSNSPSSPSERQSEHSLCQISSIHIKAAGGNTRLYQAVEAKLTLKLSSTMELIVVSDGEKSDATLKVRADWQYGILDQISDTALIEVSLYHHTDSEMTQTLWPFATSGRQYQGDSDHVIDAIAQDLINDKRDRDRCKD